MNIKVSVRVNGTTTDYFLPSGTRLSSVASNAGFREDFGLGSNIRVLRNGSTMDGAIQPGDVLTVESVASSKAARVKVAVRVNGTTTDYFFPVGTRLGAVASNGSFREDFGLGSNIRVLRNGSTMDGALQPGDVLTVESVASSKA